MATPPLKGHLVAFDRNPLDPHLLEGFALAWSDDLTLLQVVNTDRMETNGYSVFVRNVDVRRWRPLGHQTFIARAIAMKGVKPAFLETVALGQLARGTGDCWPPFSTAYPPSREDQSQSLLHRARKLDGGEDRHSEEDRPGRAVGRYKALSISRPDQGRFRRRYLQFPAGISPKSADDAMGLRSGWGIPSFRLPAEGASHAPASYLTPVDSEK